MEDSVTKAVKEASSPGVFDDGRVSAHSLAVQSLKTPFQKVYSADGK